jgi:methylmalonyl-CoA mutase cobalamin-binding domain/chain
MRGHLTTKEDNQAQNGDVQTKGREAAQIIKTQRDSLAEAIVSRIYELEPELLARFGKIGREKCLRDVKYNLIYLAEAMNTSSPSLFADYVSWLKVVLAEFEGLAEGLAEHMVHTRNVLQEVLPAEMGPVVGQYIEVGRQVLGRHAATPPTFINEESPLGELTRQYFDALLQGKRHVASQLIKDAVERDISIKDIYLKVFQPAQQEVGRLWQTNQVSVAQEHFCTAATQLIISQLYPHIFTTKRIDRRLLATSVSNELHEIGIRMVADFFEMEGWDTYYLGANTPIESIVQTAIDQDVNILGISATMTYHVSTVADLISKVHTSEVGPEMKILVGGYPFNVDPELWKKINADGYAKDAQDAIHVANQLIGGNNDDF